MNRLISNLLRLHRDGGMVDMNAPAPAPKRTVDDFNSALANEAMDTIALALIGVHLTPAEARCIHQIIDAHTWPPPERK